MTFKKTFVDKSRAFISVTIFFIKLYTLVGLGRFNFNKSWVSITDKYGSQKSNSI